MAVIEQVTNNISLSGDALILQTDCLSELCAISYTTDDQHFKVVLEAATSEVSLEGMNRFLITVTDINSDPESAIDIKNKLRAELIINLRQQMNSISIDATKPYYFSITNRSLELECLEIDSSIIEVVDLNLMDLQIQGGIKPVRSQENQNILLNAVASNLLKASISALLAQAIYCHNLVIKEADHLFANRQDYIRDMCRCIAQSSNDIATNVRNKARQSEHCLF